MGTDDETSSALTSSALTNETSSVLRSIEDEELVTSLNAEVVPGVLIGTFSILEIEEQGVVRSDDLSVL